MWFCRSAYIRYHIAIEIRIVDNMVQMSLHFTKINQVKVLLVKTLTRVSLSRAFKPKHCAPFLHTYSTTSHTHVYSALVLLADETRLLSFILR